MIKRNRRLKRVHFIGIGGSGMSGIAEVMLGLGYHVQGSDLNDSQQINRLKSQGAKIFIGHSRENICDADAVVVSSAIDNDNCEVSEAYKLMLPVVARAEMLAELMRFCYSIAVAGTHGKTTTTSLIASLLAEGGLDPTYIIGGRLKSSNSNAKLGLSEFLVAEADESDASFIHLKPMISVVTNIDFDHMSTYNNDVNELNQGFLTFLHNLPFYGLAIVCTDDPGVRKILPKIGRSYISYGISEKADVTASNIKFLNKTTRFDVTRKNKMNKLKIQINLPGKHNILNALAAIAVASELDVEDNQIENAFKCFAGIDRRFQVINSVNCCDGSFTLIDDYGHHPSEIKATIEAVKLSWPDKKITLVFQPHRFSRTRDLFDDFVDTLSTVDHVLIAEIYSAGEKPIDNINSKNIVSSLKDKTNKPVQYLPFLSDAIPILYKLMKNDEVLLVMGAGDVGKFAAELPNELAGIK
jgi:UDP-N-acetylmuramate--alanine ligase